MTARSDISHQLYVLVMNVWECAAQGIDPRDTQTGPDSLTHGTCDTIANLIMTEVEGGPPVADLRSKLYELISSWRRKSLLVGRDTPEALAILQCVDDLRDQLS